MPETVASHRRGAAVQKIVRATQEMLASTSASEPVEYLTFIVQNLAASPPKRITATLAADATLQALHEKVAEECQFVPGTFELRSKDDDAVVFRLTDKGADERLLGSEAGIVRARPTPFF